jgi:hypothetical protein
MATGAYPFLATMKPQDFTRLLGAGEIAVGSALLLLGIGVSLLLSDLVDRFSARTANHQRASMTGGSGRWSRGRNRPAGQPAEDDGLIAPRMSTTNTSVSVPLIPAWELPVFP